MTLIQLDLCAGHAMNRNPNNSIIMAKYIILIMLSLAHLRLCFKGESTIRAWFIIWMPIILILILIDVL